MPFALVSYPPSREFATATQAVVGPLEWIDLTPLGRLSRRDALRRLRKHAGRRCYLPLEDEDGRAFVPLLHTAALAAGARGIDVLLPDGQLEPRSPRAAVASVAALVGATVRGRRDVHARAAEARRLLVRDRVEAFLAAAGAALCVNANVLTVARAGGLNARVVGVTAGLAEHGLDVTLASTRRHEALAAGVRYHRLQPATPFATPFELNAYRSHAAFVAQVSTLAVRRPRFLYDRPAAGGYVGVELSRRLGIPLVVEYNGAEEWRARHWGTPLRYGQAASAAEEACLRHAHVVSVNSDVLCEEAIARGVAPERVAVHPVGVEAARFDPGRVDASVVRARLGIPPEAIVVLFAGSFGPYHGAHVLADAVRRLAAGSDWLRAGFHVVFVGDGPELPGVQETLAGVHCVHFTGLVSPVEMPGWLAAADVLVSPHVPNPDGTAFYGSPMKLFEYMAAGKAIVASDLGQIGSVLRGAAGELGVLVRPADSAELAAALRALADEPARRAELGRRARAEVTERYTWKRHTEAILTRLEEVVPVAARERAAQSRAVATPRR
jgi:glycosyltransferase involved in cell wall biosynthesis